MNAPAPAPAPAPVSTALDLVDRPRLVGRTVRVADVVGVLSEAEALRGGRVFLAVERPDGSEARFEIEGTAVARLAPAPVEFENLRASNLVRPDLAGSTVVLDPAGIALVGRLVRARRANRPGDVVAVALRAASGVETSRAVAGSTLVWFAGSEDPARVAEVLA